jgi:hypothetical protein
LTFRSHPPSPCRSLSERPGLQGPPVRVHRLLLPVLSTVLALGVIFPGSSDAVDVTWYDTEGRPLAFPSLDAIERFLATAEIISDRPLGTGRSGPRKLVLEQDGVRVAAAYNTSDTIVRGVVRQQGVTISEFHDYHLFNCAAYRLDQMLGLNRVPPTVPRDIGRMSGSVSLWIEGTFTEKERKDRGQQPPNLFRWNQQKKIMVVFDNLIGNVDRNLGNLLIDQDWRLWFIDHTRAFITTPDLIRPESVSRCERGLYEALQALDPDEVRRELSPYLSGPQIDAIFARRDLILQRLQQEIDRFGTSVVLFDLRPAES